MKLSMILVAILFAAQFVTAADVALIKGGKAAAVIVVENASVSTKKAAEELQEMLLQRTGAKLQIISDKDAVPAGMIPVYLGLSKRTADLGADEKKIPYDGYFFKVTPEYVVLAGRDKPQTNEAYYGQTFVYCNYEHHYYAYGEKGTVNGVYKILEKYAGNRHYMPGKLGEVVPESPDFVLPETEYIKAPAFQERYIYGIYFKKGSPDYLRWYYRMCAGGRNHHINHTYRRMTHFKDTHPEYFALIDGKRDFTNLSTANNFGNLCMTNEEGIKAFAAKAQQFFDKNPSYNVYPVVPQDGMYRTCECPDCKKLLSPHLGHTGRFSNLVYHHASSVAKILAKTHPGKMIGILAYEGYRVPPEIELPSNLAVRICYSRQGLRDAKNKKLVEDAIIGYKNKNVPILVWTYPLFNHRPPMKGLPVLYPDIIQENARFNRDNGVIGEFSECGYHGGNGKDMNLPLVGHLNDYIRCQLLWDPDMDVRAELELYYKNFYGPAAAEMKEFWTTAEKLFLKYGEATLYTVNDLKNFEAILARAAAKAPADTVYGKRIRMMQAEIKPYFHTMYLLRGKKKFFGVSLVKEDIPMEYSVDSVWKHAREYTLNYKSGHTVPAANRTTLYAIANEKGFAFHAVCKESAMDKMVVKAQKRDAVAWEDDCLEFFIVSADRSINRHYFISANGQMTDGRRTKDVNTADWAWNGDMKVKTVKKSNAIEYTVFIPWSDFDCDFNGLPQMLFQLYRRQNASNPKGVYQTVFPSVAFHNYSPEYFARFEFLGEENRLRNSGFEEVNEKGKPVGWDGPGSISTDKVDSGKNALNIVSQKGGAPLVLSEKISVGEDSDYSITLRHLGSAGYVYALFYDKNNKAVPEPGRTFFWTDGAKNWHTVTFQGRVPAGAVSCRVGLRVFGKSSAYFDNVEFRGGMKYIKPNKNFKNGSFEELGSDGKPLYWGKNVNLDTTTASDGKNSIRVTAGKNDSLYSERFAVTGGSNFVFKVDHKGNEGVIYVISYDAKGKNIASPYYGVNGSKDWKTSTFIGVLPENAVKCSVMVRNFNAKKYNGTCFDNVRFYSE